MQISPLAGAPEKGSELRASAAAAFAALEAGPASVPAADKTVAEARRAGWWVPARPQGVEPGPEESGGCGTPSYMSPEVLAVMSRQAEPDDITWAPTDLW